MSSSQDIRDALGNPQILRLKQIGKGVKVGKVLGDRVLVSTIIPTTEMDKVEKEGLLYIPKDMKDRNTPLPCTGVVIQVGDGVTCERQSQLASGTAVMFSRYAGTDFTVEQNDGFRILETREILCTLEIDAEAVAPISPS